MKQPQLNGPVEYPKESAEHPHDLIEKGKGYDKLLSTCARQVDEIIKLKEVLQLVKTDVKWNENSPTLKLIETTLNKSLK